jgi:superfamily I DNA and RNA helicase
MEKNYSVAQLRRDPVARGLVEHLVENEKKLRIVDGSLYFQYPLFRDDTDTLVRSSVLLAARSHGLMIFVTIQSEPARLTAAEVHRLDDELSQVDSLLFSKLLRSKILRLSSRQIKIPTRAYLFGYGELANAVQRDISNRYVSSFAALDGEILDGWLAEEIAAEHWDETLSVLEGAKGLLRPKERNIPANDPDSKGAVLARLETEIATFDHRQRRAAITFVDGPQRIRGLAGSGKTVILAMKAAQLHLTDPEAYILLTFYTKSLYGFIRALISRFYRQFTDHDPDFNRIHVRHAWGGRDIEGVYHGTCVEHGVRPIPYKEAALARNSDPFGYVCEQLLKGTRLTQKYDYVLMDEAQDFPSSFYKLCFLITKGDDYDRNVVWAYDELQNIMDVHLRSPRETFGTSPDGTSLIDLERAAQEPGDVHDVVLHKCYRNPREILICAHALGFGVYSEHPVQMLENKAHWEDVGYQVRVGNCIPGEPTVIERPEANSPLSISLHEQRDELVKTFLAETLLDETRWIANEISAFLASGLRADDIVVISLDDMNARTYFKALTAELAEREIKVNNILLDPYNPPPFVRDNHVTLSTVYRAKGNEAAVAFTLGVDAVFPFRKAKLGRNKLFTAFTRAKAWLRVSGIGRGAEAFFEEISTALELSPRMEFVYPDTAELVLLQRDLTDQAAALGKLRREIEERLEEMDLGDAEKEAFITMIARKKP